MLNKQCCKMVSRGGNAGGIKGLGYISQCNRKASVVVDGKPYCYQHNPEKVREREERCAKERELRAANKRELKAISRMYKRS